MGDAFTLWAMGDAHVGTDLRHNRRSLASAIEQSESANGFAWDIALDVGDLSGSQVMPNDEEGRNLVEQYASLKTHRREQIYNLCGNHDATAGERGVQWWFRTYGDPLGEYPDISGVHAGKRPFPVEGTWERYKFEAGNLLFLIMSDRNDGDPPVGRGDRHGGYPAGAVTGETFDWWVSEVESNTDKIIISAHHHMLKETTFASGEWEGFGGRDRHGNWRGKDCARAPYHGYFADGGPMGASYLYFVDGHPDAQAFERYLAQHPGAIDIWIGGHTHAMSPDETVNGRGPVERKWDVNFINCAGLTRHHVNIQAAPLSRPITFCAGECEAQVRCYMHSDEFEPQGFSSKAEYTIPLRHAFQAPAAVAGQ